MNTAKHVEEKKSTFNKSNSKKHLKIKKRIAAALLSLSLLAGVYTMSACNLNSCSPGTTILPPDILDENGYTQIE